MLYLRHADKEYSNGESREYSLDPGITSDGKERIMGRVPFLLEKYGIPTKIISSPYLRTRQTAEIIQDIIYKITGEIVPIFHDSMIGEYLGNKRSLNINKCLRPETLRYKPIPPETWTQYNNRIAYHNKTSQQCKENIWYISHGLVIQRIAGFYGNKIDYPGPLMGINVNNGIVQIV